MKQLLLCLPRTALLQEFSLFWKRARDSRHAGLGRHATLGAPRVLRVPRVSRAMRISPALLFLVDIGNCSQPSANSRTSFSCSDSKGNPPSMINSKGKSALYSSINFIGKTKTKKGKLFVHAILQNFEMNSLCICYETLQVGLHPSMSTQLLCTLPLLCLRKFGTWYNNNYLGAHAWALIQKQFSKGEQCHVS